MSLAEIESAVDALSTDQKRALFRYLKVQLENVTEDEVRRPVQSVLDIAPVQLGAILCPFNVDDDLLGEMLDSPMTAI